MSGTNKVPVATTGHNVNILSTWLKRPVVEILQLMRKNYAMYTILTAYTKLLTFTSAQGIFNQA